MRDFLKKIGPQDKVLLIGDTRQHQGVDAGKPFEQLQEAGMRTAQLDQIMRQKDPALLKAVEHLSNNETTLGVEMLSQQGRITEIIDPEQRVAAIAKEYAAHPENTLIVSPDNASRRAINQTVRQELQTLGVVDSSGHSMRVLTPRNDMTGADREWASRYQTGDVLHYTRGSKEHGIRPRSYAQVVTTDAKENLVTVRKQDGQQVTYDPSRLRGIAAYREIEREFATGEKIQFTAPNRDLQVSNRGGIMIQHPSRQPYGRVLQPVKCLRTGAHLLRIAEAVLIEKVELFIGPKLVARKCGLSGTTCRQCRRNMIRHCRRHVRMDADQLWRREQRHLFRNRVAPIAALRQISGVIKALHQHRPSARNPDRVPTGNRGLS
jgi:hypothetical protein